MLVYVLYGPIGWMSAELSLSAATLPTLGEHAKGSQLLGCVPHVVRVQEHRQHLQRPVRDDERLGAKQRGLHPGHPRHGRVVSADQLSQGKVVTRAHLSVKRA